MKIIVSFLNMFFNSEKLHVQPVVFKQCHEFKCVFIFQHTKWKSFYIQKQIKAWMLNVSMYDITWFCFHIWFAWVLCVRCKNKVADVINNQTIFTNAHQTETETAHKISSIWSISHSSKITSKWLLHTGPLLWLIVY